VKSIELYATKVFVEGYPKSRHANYRYILLESEREMDCLGQKYMVPCFGLEVVREDMDGDNVYAIDRDRIEIITTYRYKAVQLLKKLYDNCVSPINFVEIAGPFADDWVNDFDDVLSGAAVQ
jgi:hypothetical protein